MSEIQQRIQSAQQALGALQERIKGMGAAFADAGTDTARRALVDEYRQLKLQHDLTKLALAELARRQQRGGVR
jgi:hypothetical protein